MFDHEKLDVYQLSLHFLTWVTPLLQEATQAHGPKTSEVSDHLDRASLSIVLNTAEGNGKRRKLIRAKFFDDARGSATECAACLDALVAKGVSTKERIREGKEILVRIVFNADKVSATLRGRIGRKRRCRRISVKLTSSSFSSSSSYSAVRKSEHAHTTRIIPHRRYVRLKKTKFARK